MNEQPPPHRDRSDSRWTPPADTDLVGLPLFVGMGVAAVAVVAAFMFIGGLAGLIVLIAVLVLALAVSYRAVMASDVED
jgi:hypothetical protein